MSGNPADTRTLAPHPRRTRPTRPHSHPRPVRQLRHPTPHHPTPFPHSHTPPPHPGTTPPPVHTQVRQQCHRKVHHPRLPTHPRTTHPRNTHSRILFTPQRPVRQLRRPDYATTRTPHTPTHHARHHQGTTTRPQTLYLCQTRPRSPPH
ncbi:protodermal factor 1-like [Octopus sinensis]|uniref:Protodermal factor 1-like n=1 Tax=Octopus sinensis TaxID=2607531 RepID=A0A6P7TUG8_9MOLL|nr:protodermal factor 1-like [Octopus sinensis]